MEKAVGDVNDFELEVTRITINGTTARAEVTHGEGERSSAFELAREGEAWRVTSLAG